MSIFYRAAAFFLAIISAMIMFFKSLPERIFGKETTTVTETTKLDGTAAFGNTDEILVCYNAAVSKTSGGTVPKGKSIGRIRGKVTVGNIAVEKVLNSLADGSAFSESVTDYIPGNAAITADDVISATATTNGTLTEIELVIKGQTDEFNADAAAGPVGRAIGTMGSINGALEALGATVVSGAENASLEYKNVRVYCLIDNDNGKIVKGEWSYDVDVSITEMTVRISSIETTLTGLYVPIYYEVVI